MELILQCLNCQKRYKVEISNTTIYGPVIYTECPFCKNKIKRNLSKFIEIQMRHKVKNRFFSVNAMKEFAKLLERKMIEGY